MFEVLVIISVVNKGPQNNFLFVFLVRRWQSMHCPTTISKPCLGARVICRPNSKPTEVEVTFELDLGLDRRPPFGGHFATWAAVLTGGGPIFVAVFKKIFKILCSCGDPLTTITHLCFLNGLWRSFSKYTCTLPWLKRPENAQKNIPTLIFFYWTIF